MKTHVSKSIRFNDNELIKKNKVLSEMSKMTREEK